MSDIGRLRIKTLRVRELEEENDRLREELATSQWWFSILWEAHCHATKDQPRIVPLLRIEKE